MENKNELFEKIFILKNIIEKLKKEGILKEKIEFPSICVIGGVNFGKSSVLESILNLNILPIGDGRITRCPIEINLNHINSEESYAIFENIKYDDFSKLKDELYNHLSNLAKNDSIEKTQMTINIYSKNYPDLKLIDLPGFNRIPPGQVPKFTEEYPIRIAENYINNPLNILLCVIPANGISNSPSDYSLVGLKIASEMSSFSQYPNNLRKLGVLTKIEIMDVNNDVRNFLLNKEIPIELGYIGVIYRNKKEMFNNISKEDILKKEKDFFNSQKQYNDLPKDLLGNEALIKKISKIFFKLIKDNFIKSYNKEEKLKELVDFLEENSLKDDEINYINKKIEKTEEKTSSDKKVKKYGNLFG